MNDVSFIAGFVNFALGFAFGFALGVVLTLIAVSVYQQYRDASHRHERLRKRLEITTKGSI